MAKRKVTVESGLHRGDYRSLTYWNMFKKDQRVIWMLAALVIIGSACIIFAGNNRILLIAGILLAACPLLTIALMEYNILKVLKKDISSSALLPIIRSMIRGFQHIRKPFRME